MTGGKWIVQMFALLLLMVSAHTSLAGVMAGKTRVIFHQQREQALMLVNTNPYPVIVQSWIDDGRGSPDYAAAPFIVTPAIFRLEPKQIQGIRLIYTAHPLPADRESVFWLNLYEVPPQSKQANPSAKLTMTMNTQLKVFYRPDSLAKGVAQVNPAHFTMGKDAHGRYIEYDNTTPYHISFTTLALSTKSATVAVIPQPDMMAYPFNKKRYYLPATTKDNDYQTLLWRYLSDNGAEQEGNRSLTSQDLINVH